jgi:glucosamine kinase
MDVQITYAVDGGGTRCRAALITGGRRFDATGGPANVSSDFAGAIATVRRLLVDLTAAAGLGPDALTPARGYLALAGIMSPADGDRVANTLGLNAVVQDDQNAAITGALGGRDGAVCAVGTGSFLGRQTDGAIRRIGGHGFHLGDQASGAWMGRMLMTRAFLARDGVIPPTPLLTRMLDRDFGPGGPVAFQFRATPADWAALAPDIAASSDPAAQDLRAEGAAYLKAGLAALGWTPGEPLCLTGGLGPAYAPFLPPSTAPQGTALDGALILAAR